MPQYRTRPLPVDAIRFIGSNLADVAEFTGYQLDFGADDYHDTIVVEAEYGDLQVDAGDWIVRIDGEVSRVRPDAFSRRYEAV